MTNLVEAKCILENIDMDELRSRSTFSSKNTLKAMFAHLDILSISYVKYMEAQSNDPSVVDSKP